MARRWEQRQWLVEGFNWKWIVTPGADRGCNAIPKKVFLFSPADPVGPQQFGLFIMNGCELSLTPGATVRLVELIKGDKFVINNQLWKCFDLFCSSPVYFVAKNAILFHERSRAGRSHLIHTFLQILRRRHLAELRLCSDQLKNKSMVLFCQFFFCKRSFFLYTCIYYNPQISPAQTAKIDHCCTSI